MKKIAVQFFNVAAGNEKAVIEQLLIIVAAATAYGVIEMARVAIL